MQSIDQILFIDKPRGVTSFDVLRRLRKQLNTRKIGHAGTLDPLATGLMVVGVNEGTKLLKEYIGLDKEYIAEIRIGERRTTGDVDGEVLEKVKVPPLHHEHISNVLATMIGTHRLEVSRYSAMKKAGVPFYKIARRAEKTGEQVRSPIRDMDVHAAELQSIICIEELCVATVRFVVGSGTYIRSLGEELGRRLGYPATLQNLRRTKVGDFCVENAQKLREV